MISIARTFGAPTSVPAGKRGREQVELVRPGASRPLTPLTMCMTWL